MNLEIALLCIAVALIMSACVTFYRMIGEMLVVDKKTRIFIWSTALSLITAICLLSFVQLHEKEQKHTNSSQSPSPTYYDHSKWVNEQRDTQRQGG
jgi:hypothetical protein